MKEINEITGKVLVCVLIISVGVLINTELYAKDQEKDIVYLKNGSIIRGDITELIPTKEVKIQTKDGSLFVYDFKEVEKIETKKAKSSKKESAEISNRFTGNLNLFLGYKILAPNWEPFEDHTEFGVLMDFKKTDWPVSMTINLLNSNDDGPYENVNIDNTTTELNLGVRKIWDNHSIVRPFIGGGLALIRSEIKGTTVK